MIPNKSNRILSALLALAFLMPLLVKSEHLLFSDHDHHFHCHSCEGIHLESSDNHCEILEFDYFFFTPAKIQKLSVSIESIAELGKTPVIDLFRNPVLLSYSLRAPPCKILIQNPWFEVQ